MAASKLHQSLDALLAVYNNAASKKQDPQSKIPRSPFWSMLPKKNTSVATLALVFSLVAVPPAIAGAPLSVGSTLTPAPRNLPLPVVRAHQLQRKNPILFQPFDRASGDISVTSFVTHSRNITLSQVNPTLPENAQSQSGNGLWGLLPILAILGLVWGWYKSRPSQTGSTENSPQSNTDDRDRNLTPRNTGQKLSDEVTAPQTIASQKNTETSSTAVPAETVENTRQTDGEFSQTESLNKQVTAAETSETSIAVTESSNHQSEEMTQDLTSIPPSADDKPADIPPTASSELPENPSPETPQTGTLEDSTAQTATPPENEASAEPATESNRTSDLTPSNETQLSDNAYAMLQASLSSTKGEPTPLDIEAAKFNLGQTKPVEPQLASVDEGLAELPDGYGKTKIVLMPREPNSAYAYWDIPNEDKEKLRKQGGEQLALRFYDVTGIDMDQQKPHSVRQYDCEEMTREWYIEVPMSDRDYIVEIGYVTEKGRWLLLARSLHVRIPPVYPCDWYGDDFRTVNWEENLRQRVKDD